MKVERDEYRLTKEAYEIIYHMDSNEVFYLDNCLDGIILAIKKDADYNKLKPKTPIPADCDYMNIVTIAFMLNNVAIAYTFDIHVLELETVLNDIMHGRADYFIDDNRPFEEIVRQAQEAVKEA